MVNKANLKFFFLIGISYLIPLLLWLMLTPSLSENKYFLNYSLPRFFVILFFLTTFLLFLLGFFFSGNKKVNSFFSKLLKSKKSFFLFHISTFFSLFFLIGSLCDIFQDINTLFLRFLSLPILLLLFSLEFLIFQEILYKGVIRKSFFESPFFLLPKERRLAFFVLIIMIGFFCAVGFHYAQGVYLGEQYPRNTFLFEPHNRFTDFFFPLEGSHDLDPYNPEKINYIGGYFPFGYFVAFLFSRIQPWVLSLTILFLVFIIFLLFFIKKVIYRNQSISYSEIINIFVIAAMTYPILFALDRANFDILVFIFIALFAWYYQKGNKTIATLLLAIPIAMKGYAVVLLLIPLIDKRIRDVIITSGLVLLLELISLALFQDGLITEFTKMVTSFFSAYRIAFEAGSLIRFNSSLFTFLLFLRPSLITTNWFGNTYFIASILVFLVTALLLILYHFPFWKKLMVIIILMILLPNSSADYRLIMLLIPMLFYVTSNEISKLDFLITSLLGLIFIPKAYFLIDGDVNLGTLLNPLLLVALLFLLISSSTMPKNRTW